MLPTGGVNSVWINLETCEGVVEEHRAAAAFKEARLAMSVLRGKGRGLELMFAGRPFDEGLAELRARLDERPDFYRGSAATAVFGEAIPAADQLAELRTLLGEFGIGLGRLEGPPELQAIAGSLEIDFLSRVAASGGELARRRANRPKRELQLSEAAKSLVADFAGARSDLAARRTGPPVLRQFTPSATVPAPHAPPAPPAAPADPPTLYHVGTIRGGQSLHNVGNIVVVGDVNPGSELVASGDIVVFGALRGVAHAGAQGDTNARVYALTLAATQLRIATYIAADASAHAPSTRVAPEVACVNNGRITIASYDQAASLSRETVQ